MESPVSAERSYQSTSQVSQSPVKWKKYLVRLAGRTNDAHLEFLTMLRGFHNTEVFSPEECDYILIFCPIVSRVGTDIGEALQDIPVGVPVILVVMHHTFDVNCSVISSGRLVDNPNVHLTVDCLFYEAKLLNCTFNDTARDQIQFLLVGCYGHVARRRGSMDRQMRRRMIILFLVILVMIVLGLILTFVLVGRGKK